MARAICTWDRPGLERGVEELCHLSDRVHIPTIAWAGPLHEAMLARLDGRLDVAESILEEAIGALAALGSESLLSSAMNHYVLLMFDRGRLGDIVTAVRQTLAPGGPQARIPAATAALAFAEALAGDREAAQLLLGQLGPEPLRSLPDDANLPVAFFLLARTAIQLGDVAVMADLIEAGRRFASVGVVTGGASVVFGSGSMVLAELGIALGRLAGAEADLATAEEDHRRVGARALLVECRLLRARLRAAQGDEQQAAELAREALAAAQPLGLARVARSCQELIQEVGPPSPGAESAICDREDAGPQANRFVRDGDVWLLSFGGRSVRLRDSKGLSDIAVLLARPGREVHVAELVGGGAPGERGGRDRLLDDAAIASYRARLLELEDVQAEADARADVERSSLAGAERDALLEELGRGLGLGGRARAADDGAERARKAVRTRIASTLKRIEAEHPRLGRHLRASIRTGAFCSYEPPEPTSWSA